MTHPSQPPPAQGREPFCNGPCKAQRGSIAWKACHLDCAVTERQSSRPGGEGEAPAIVVTDDERVDPDADVVVPASLFRDMHAAYVGKIAHPDVKGALLPETAARLFHDTYERLAPSFGYETRTDTKQFDLTTPNGRLMTAVCAVVLSALPEDSGWRPDRKAISREIKRHVRVHFPSDANWKIIGHEQAADAILALPPGESS